MSKARPNLDDFISIDCFKAVIVGMEDILGPEGTASAMIAAGRRRGNAVATQAGVVGANPDVSGLAALLNSLVGKEGTCLCNIVEVSKTPEGFLVKADEIVCAANEPEGSTRGGTYSLGALLGFFEAAYGLRLVGIQTANTLLGSPTDDFLLKEGF